MLPTNRGQCRGPGLRARGRRGCPSGRCPCTVFGPQPTSQIDVRARAAAGVDHVDRVRRPLPSAKRGVRPTNCSGAVIVSPYISVSANVWLIDLMNARVLGQAERSRVAVQLGEILCRSGHSLSSMPQASSICAVVDFDGAMPLVQLAPPRSEVQCERSRMAGSKVALQPRYVHQDFIVFGQQFGDRRHAAIRVEPLRDIEQRRIATTKSAIVPPESGQVFEVRSASDRCPPPAEAVPLCVSSPIALPMRMQNFNSSG